MGQIPDGAPDTNPGAGAAGGVQQAAIPTSSNGALPDRNVAPVAATPSVIFDVLSQPPVASVPSAAPPSASPAPATAPAPGATARPLVVDAERKLLYGILAVVLIFLMGALALNVLHLANVYANAEAFMEKEVKHGRLHPNTALHHLNGVMAAHMIGTHKSAALTLSFVVVVLGALLVVKGSEASYELKLHGKDTKSELVTSSPGLVMITLALGLAMAVVLHSSEVAIFTKGTAQEPGGETRMPNLNPPPEPRVLPPDDPPPSEQAPTEVKK